MSKPLLKAERAIALDPNDAEGYVVLADMLNMAGGQRKPWGCGEGDAPKPSLSAWYLFRARLCLPT